MKDDQYQFDVHVALVSNQAAQNLTPILDRRFKPREVVLVASPQMHPQALWLRDVFSLRGIRVKLWAIEDAWDIQHIQDRLLELLSDHEGGSLALNVSGGTKAMSMAAYEVFRAYDKPIFYVDAETDRLSWLHPRRETAVELEDRIKLEPYLLTYGSQVERAGSRDGVGSARRQLTDTLIRESDRFREAMPKLNWYAHSAERNLMSKPLHARHRGDVEFSTLIELFEAHKLLTFEDERMRFIDEDSRFFANGGWLEAYVYGLLYNMRKDKPSIQDIGRSVEVMRGDYPEPVRNELDVALLANNRLYIIECKTKRFSRAPHSPKSGADTLYKLDTLKALLGGLHAEAMLISYHALRKFDRQRADDLNIAVCAGEELGRLRERLARWIA